MTKFKRVIALVLSLAVICGLFAVFAGCVNVEEIEQKQQQIDELQAQLDSQQKEIDEIKAQLESKQKEIDELKRENDSSTFQIGNLKKDIKTLVGQLSELMEQDLETLSKDDEEVMKSYREPCLEENFEDNTVDVILKSRFVGLVGFDDFAVTKSVSEVIAIKHRSETIYKGSYEKFPIYRGYTQGFTLTLATHDKKKVLKVAEILRKLDMVLIARPSYIYTAVPCSIPSDTNYSAQWGLNGNYGINVEGAWNYTQGDDFVKVGVMEVGYEVHADLENIANGNLPYWSIDDEAMQEQINHGTHVAGIIGSNRDNNKGIAGIAKCSMYMLNPDDLVGSLKYAADNGIKIINASFICGYRNENNSMVYLPFNPDHYDAIKEYGENGGLLICAASNEDRNNDDKPVYPASYDLPNIISVGSIDRNGDKSSFSTYGKQSVDIFAPGGNILSTYPQSRCPGEIFQASTGQEFRECEYWWREKDEQQGVFELIHKPTEHYNNGYHYMSGTSMAAPHVTGVAALLLAKYPDMTAGEIKCTILDNVDKASNLSNSCVSGGRLNAYKALSNPHKHNYTNSYEQATENRHKEICICGAYIDNVHYYANSYESIDAEQHKQICICGAYRINRHDYTYSYKSINSDQHKSICACGEYVSAPHNYLYRKTDGMQHNITCVCGRIGESHLFICKRINGQEHKYNCKCGQYTEPHIVLGGWDVTKTNKCMICGGIVDIGWTVIMGSVDTLVTDNGSYIMPNGVIVLMYNDCEAYFNGTLEFKVKCNQNIDDII